MKEEAEEKEKRKGVKKKQGRDESGAKKGEEWEGNEKEEVRRRWGRIRRI